MVACTIQLISETQAQQNYAVSALWYALEKDTFDKQPLAQVATWCIGEYGDLLLYGPPVEDAETPINVSLAIVEILSYFTLGLLAPFYLNIYNFVIIKFLQLTEEEVIDVYQRLLWNPQNTVITKQYTLLSLTKLSTRFQKGHESVLSLFIDIYP